MNIRNLIAFDLLILFFIIDAVFSDGACDGEWTAYNDEKCLKVFNTEIGTYEEADSFCKGKYDANLVSIGFEDKQKFVENFLKSNEIVDNVWIGLKYESDNNYVWSDSTDFVFSNWASGSPKNDPDYCVQIETEDATYGKWVDVPCTKRNVVLCEKLQSWSLSQLQNEFINLKKNLIPVGFIYVQLPKEKPPAEIWSWMTWEDITKDYAGVFFRAEGGNSSAFGKVQEGDSPRLIKSTMTGYIDSRSTNRPTKTDRTTEALQFPIEFPANGMEQCVYGDFMYINSNTARVYLDEKRLYLTVSDTEVRPRNMAVRIWKRMQ